jgi:endonuclease/exonuclease/phosphatase family metal-dependent hydrolase
MALEQIETGSFAPELSHAVVAETLRVISWNINRGSCFDLIVDFLASADADIVLLQECDSHAIRSGFRLIAREIAQKLNMNYAFGVEFVELSQGKGDREAHHGQATLCRVRLSKARILRLRNQSSFWAPRWYIPRVRAFQRRLGGRMALVSEIVVNRTILVLYNLHLESRRSDELRWRQLKEVLDDTEGYGPDVPVIIGGDFNADLTSETFRAAIAGSRFRNPFAAQKAPTIISPRRVSRRPDAIDFILLRGSVGEECARVHTSVSGSDHCPLSLALQLP